ncbi:putative GABA permease [Aspergillus saccharolyticus JOP 1030-1]|uniref:Putative amino acid permease n=1 Tax=Aspergillus saccharolyticus JOP 1030-1 TaxID=1450539 RepID=A0A318ZJA6_9EURO|nr:putative amino acid permease [Aspergillus saccharolyticus JOP 1030-1]PYH46907.1 putative amino acid permease [Aspergillus saccharolyticus JOP 1030-1]
MTDRTTFCISKSQGQPDSSSRLSDHVEAPLDRGREELPVQFSLFSTIALGFSMTNSWLGYSATFVTPLLMGGSPAVFFGLIVASVATAGLAELASAYPSSSGQYHFAFMVSSPKYRPVVAFTMGWLSVVAWALTSASTAIVCAQMIGNLASIYHPSYTAESWQTYLIYALLILIATAIVCLLPRALPKGEIVMFISSFLGFVASFITVLATQNHKQSAAAVFLDYKNTSGWSDGTSFLIGLGTCMYAYLAIDGACHIAEELPNPSQDVPRAMGLTMLIGVTTVIPWTLAFLFSATDTDAVASSSIPIYTVYLQATRSQPAATMLTVWILFVYAGALVSCIVTTGRLAYAFARDEGLPYSKFFAQIHTKREAPVNATIGCAAIILLYGLIYIGSATAFNSFISMSILSLNMTYAVPQAIVLVRGRDRILPKRSFNLGRYLGPVCNAFSAFWVPFITILFCFPTSLPTTVSDMNYVSVVISGITILILLSWWGGKRKTFSGPVRLPSPTFCRCLQQC